jgi:uncharacterized membrane protein
LFLIGTGLALTIAVELIALVGDIGRMNTIFKLYLQAWTMLSVSAAAALGWTLPGVLVWRERWRVLWQAGLTLLLAGAFFFTLSATMDKIRDRMNMDAPHTLDSMKYMETSTYWDSTDMDLGQDYRAIRWMQDNVQGSPVIIEGNCPEYRWCTRFTIYTGLPGVVGWNWHQRHHRHQPDPGLPAPLQRALHHRRPGGKDLLPRPGTGQVRSLRRPILDRSLPHRADRHLSSQIVS